MSGCYTGGLLAPVFPAEELTPACISTSHTCATAARSICKHSGTKLHLSPPPPPAPESQPTASMAPGWQQPRETRSSAPIPPGLACPALGKTLHLSVPPSNCPYKSRRCHQPVKAWAQRAAPPPPRQHHCRQKQEGKTRLPSCTFSP